MLASIVHNHDCHFTSVYLWLYIYTSSFDCEPFVNISIHIDYVCVFDAFFLLSLLFLFAVLFYLYTVLDYVWVCNFTFVHLTFSVLFNYFFVTNALINCFVLWLLHPLLPYHPVLFFVCLLFLVSILCYFSLYMLLWLL